MVENGVELLVDMKRDLRLQEILKTAREDLGGHLKLTEKVVRLVHYVNDRIGTPPLLNNARSKLLETLKQTNQPIPLGKVQLGMPQHCALLFKLLCEDLGLSCKLVKFDLSSVVSKHVNIVFRYLGKPNTSAVAGSETLEIYWEDDEGDLDSLLLLFSIKMCC